MAVEYYCDGCGEKIQAASKLNPTSITTIEIINSDSQVPESKLLCGECTSKLKEFIPTLKKEK